MNWFNKLSRNVGLAIHNIADPYNQKSNNKQRKVISKKVEQENISPSITLRKTTIEEVEMRDDKGANKNQEQVETKHTQNNSHEK